MSIYFRQIKSSLKVALVSVVTLLCSVFFMNNVMAAGLLTPVDSQLPALEIKSHDVDVVIEDGYAITTVEQVFHNPHAQDLEAVYSFPVPDKGAVAEFTVWIDDKPVSGEVLEKQQARQLYEEEKRAGRDAGLTEKDSYKTFDISVTPVRAGQDTRIRFAYMQTAHVDTGIGRYVYPLEEGGVDEKKLAFWTADETVRERFSFKMTLKSGYPVEALRLPNNPQAVINKTSAGEWHAQITSSATTAAEEGAVKSQSAQSVYMLDKDIVVYWRHQQGLPGSVDLVSYKPEGSNRGTFMLTLTPGDDLKPVTEGKDWVFVLDLSGSMQGKYHTLVDGVQRAITKMRQQDRFRIVLFNNSAHELTSGYVAATPENVRRYSDALLQSQPNGGTNLHAGIIKGLDSIDADRTSAIVLVTDGVANVGETQQRKFIELLKKKDVRLFTFIMGNSANKPLLAAMTKVSNGFALNISNSDDIVGKILEATNKVTHESYHGVSLSIGGIKTADVTPENIGSLYRGQQLVVLGHYWGDGIAEIKLTGKVSGKNKEYRTLVKFPDRQTTHPELERLWAYALIEERMAEIRDFGEDADLKQSIIDIATEYSLVTDYTSMIVVRDEVFDMHGIKRNNKQRLENEKLAKSQRFSQAPVSRRADTNQPMFTSSRPSFSGGGSVDMFLLMLFMPVLWLRKRMQKTG